MSLSIDLLAPGRSRPRFKGTQVVWGNVLVLAWLDITVMLPGNVGTPIIDAFGLDRAALPIRPMPAGTAMRETVMAFLKHQPVQIPGRMRTMTRLLPRTRSLKLNGRMLGQAHATSLARNNGHDRSGPDQPPGKAESGMDIAVITTQRGSKSQQNAQRQGFDLLYTRAVLVKQP